MIYCNEVGIQTNSFLHYLSAYLYLSIYLSIQYAGNLRNMAIDMGSELDNQNRMIERINTKVMKSLYSTLTPCKCSIFHIQSSCVCVCWCITHTIPDTHLSQWCQSIDVDDENILIYLINFVSIFSSSLFFVFAFVFMCLCICIRLQGESNETRIAVANERAHQLLK